MWVMEPHPDDVCIEDIAHALSMTCRFAGHSVQFYSVAEHSFIVGSKEGIHGLLHDAAEAYLLDIPRPYKDLLCFALDGRIESYRDVEDRMMATIYEGLGLTHPTEEEAIRVKRADQRVLATEKVQLMHEGHEWALPEDAYDDVRLRFWDPTAAEQRFLEMYTTYRTGPRRERDNG